MIKLASQHRYIYNVSINYKNDQIPAFQFWQTFVIIEKQGFGSSFLATSKICQFWFMGERKMLRKIGWLQSKREGDIEGERERKDDEDALYLEYMILSMILGATTLTNEQPVHHLNKPCN